MRFLAEATKLPTCKKSFMKHLATFDEGRFFFIHKIIKATRLVGARGEEAKNELYRLEEEIAYILALGTLLSTYSSMAGVMRESFLLKVEKLGINNFSHLEYLTQHYIQMIDVQLSTNNKNSVRKAMHSYRMSSREERC